MASRAGKFHENLLTRFTYHTTKHKRSDAVAPHDIQEPRQARHHRNLRQPQILQCSGRVLRRNGIHSSLWREQKDGRGTVYGTETACSESEDRSAGQWFGKG